MSIKHEPTPDIPAETCRVVHAILPRGNLVTRMRDHLGPQFTDEQFTDEQFTDEQFTDEQFTDEQFTDLFSSTGQPAFAPWRLALITLWQFLEHLTDRQAAEAVGTRIDWKYALALDLTEGAIDHTVLSEFRTRLVHGTAEDRLFEILLLRLREAGYVKAGGHQRTDSTHVLAAIRQTHRLERVMETVRATLNVLAAAAPDWIHAHIPLDWVARYDHRSEMFRLPKSAAQREDLAHEVGVDGQAILRWIDEEPQWSWLKELPIVQTLQRMWATQYTHLDTTVQWRPEEEMPSPCEQIASPYDPEARWATKGSTRWVGYKVHFTETCDPQSPHLITQVETTPAPQRDDQAIGRIHEQAAQRALLPHEHVVDTGYICADTILQSWNHYGVLLLGPLRKSGGWQAAKQTGFAKSQFHIDWEQQTVQCPTGRSSISWRKGKTGIRVDFARSDCQPCPMHSRCTKRAYRTIGLRSQPVEETLRATRVQEMTEDFQHRYALRAGIEGTHAQALRRCGSRRSRYCGEAKTRLQMAATASALNLIRLDAWLQEDAPAKTRHARFARLLAS